MRKYLPNFRVLSGDTQSLFGVTIGRVSVDFGVWCTPGIEWGRWGYDCIWRTWAVYPLFEVEVLQPEFF